MKASTLWWYSLLLATALLGVGVKLLLTTPLSTQATLEALVILTMLVGLQVRFYRALKWDIRDGEGAARDDWKREFCLIVLGFQLTLGFGLWLATGLLRG